MKQPCGPCRTLLWRRAWQEPPHATLRWVTHGPPARWPSGSGRRTQYQCATCEASLVRSSFTREEPGWRLGSL